MDPGRIGDDGLHIAFRDRMVIKDPARIVTVRAVERQICIKLHALKRRKRQRRSSGCDTDAHALTLQLMQRSDHSIAHLLSFHVDQRAVNVKKGDLLFHLLLFLSDFLCSSMIPQDRSLTQKRCALSDPYRCVRTQKRIGLPVDPGQNPMRFLIPDADCRHRMATERPFPVTEKPVHR